VPGNQILNDRRTAAIGNELEASASLLLKISSSDLINSAGAEARQVLREKYGRTGFNGPLRYWPNGIV